MLLPYKNLTLPRGMFSLTRFSESWYNKGTGQLFVTDGICGQPQGSRKLG